ncbi:type I restriction enzyme HsdR N-terminal domain-containing protein [Novosphingobium sp.]|uniref:type I restriction enzyme HsdR N-terminal domain-containing protein n=1 Tax=Novosphingobium sp. TaxID=1874826 RepID=UPI0026055A6C|nr:type I restriction enzyme HsdR N-terminal domain-containing protein [Novosphingobium sp.]
MNVIGNSVAVEAPDYNEASVRFHIIDPIVRSLGYHNQNNTYLILEEKLAYPYIHIGHRSKKDVPVGYPDYRAGLKGARGSFIIEAKSGRTDITKREIEQAHSYAAHAQVGANYFVICNGLEIRVYETLSGPDVDPIILVPISEIDDRFHEIENILSPINLALHCRVEYDKKLKLCDGLKSHAKILTSSYTLEYYDYKISVNETDFTDHFRTNLPQFTEMEQQIDLLGNVLELRIEEGDVARDEDGRISAYARFRVATIPNGEAMRLIGIDEIWLETSDRFISKKSYNPTIFESSTGFFVPNCAMMPTLFGVKATIDNDIEGNLFILADMHFNGLELIGQSSSFSDFHIELPNKAIFLFEMNISGTFALRLDL